ncbi:MAG: class I SAM-dependent methyltransferase [Ruminococcus flavefaciens]|nr:class I SAM-dependent methyltransferase [Ruminococcus flavefaciens]
MARVYDERVKINYQANELFWEKRADVYSEKHPYVSIKLNDKNPDFSDMADKYEKTNILPLLEINTDSYILDIGCGVGRLAEQVIDQCRYYLGTDIAKGLTDIANKRIISETEHDFIPVAFQNIQENSDDIKYIGKYNRIMIAGIFLFINDEDIKKCIDKLLVLCAEHTKIYVSTPIALDKRLTLTEWESEDFDNKYNAIYRTMDEYLALYQPLLDAGFHIERQDFFAKEIQRFTETSRHYFIFER